MQCTMSALQEQWQQLGAMAVAVAAAALPSHMAFNWDYWRELAVSETKEGIKFWELKSTGSNCSVDRGAKLGKLGGLDRSGPELFQLLRSAPKWATAIATALVS
jgi:hypothetical protein